MTIGTPSQKLLRLTPGPALLLLLLTALGPACQRSSPTDSGPPAAVVTLTIAPVSSTVVCPTPDRCLATIDATVTLAETAGLGARVQGIDIVVRNLVTNLEETSVSFDAEWVRTQVGSDRLEPSGRLAFRPVLSGIAISTNQPAARLVLITARIRDDKGNQLAPSAGIQLQPV